MTPDAAGSSAEGAGAAPAITAANAHARYAAYAAAKLGYAFRSLDGDDAYLFEITDGARRAFFSVGAGSAYALNRAHAAAIARDKLFAQRVLAAHGLPVIPSELFFITDEHAAMRAPGRELADALAYAARADYPIFCKPLDGSQGAFAEIITDARAFARYVERARTRHYAILAQPFIEATEHRVLVLHDAPLYAYQKVRPAVVGDGVSTLAQLAPHAARGRDHTSRLYAATDIPPAGVALTLDGPANRALGGSARGFATSVPASQAELARRAAAAIGLPLAGVDMFEADNAHGFVIIEINASPAIRTLEAHDRWDLIETIWRANIEAAFASP